MKEKCTKCEHLPKVPSAEAKVFFFFEHELLKIKIQDLFKELSIEFDEFEEGVIVKTSDFKKLLQLIKESSYFSSPELNGISLILLKPEEKPSLKHFKNLKSLQTWFNLLDAEVYLNLLEKENLIVHFQPILSTEMEILGYECLVRGVTPQGELIFPNSLFEWALKTDTLFYLDRTCRELCLKSAATKGLRDKYVFINFTPNSIYDPAFCLKNTTRLAYQLKFEPEYVVFEVVESQKVSDIKHLSNILNYYRNYGFKVALDDVGSGYASLEILVNLRPDIIKIEKEIIRNVYKDPLRQSIVKSISQICRENGIKVIAEGIETKEEFLFLRDLVDYVQGFFFAKPSPEPFRSIRLGQEIF